MDRDEALERLAGIYARALRLEEAGLDLPDIARELGIDPASVEPLLTIGRRKLQHLMDQNPAPEPPGADRPASDHGDEG